MTMDVGTDIDRPENGWMDVQTYRLMDVRKDGWKGGQRTRECFPFKSRPGLSSPPSLLVFHEWYDRPGGNIIHRQINSGSSNSAGENLISLMCVEAHIS